MYVLKLEVLLTIKFKQAAGSKL